MRKILLVLSIPLLVVACNRNCCKEEVVKETYIHQYGAPVTEQDWKTQGQSGQVVQLRADGVTVTTSYDNGALHGDRIYTFPNSSTVQTTETFECNTLVSTQQNYSSGLPMVKEHYQNDQLTELSRWYEDGTPSTLERYQEGHLHHAEYRTPSNIVESTVQEGYGKRTTRSGNGELLCKEAIQGGEMVERTTYFMNGDPSSTTPFKNSRIHGTRLSFLRGGIPNTVEQWAHGYQDGVTIVYQNGEKFAEIPHVRGEKNGVERRYLEGNILFEEITWRNNLQHGEKTLHVDGAQKSTWYHKGDIVSRAAFDRMNPRR